MTASAMLLFVLLLLVVVLGVSLGQHRFQLRRGLEFCSQLAASGESDLSAKPFAPFFS